MLANIAIAYLAVGIIKAAFHLGIIHGYVHAGQSKAWGRMREFPRYILGITLFFYACAVTVAWPFHRLPSAGSTEVSFGLKGKPKA